MRQGKTGRGFFVIWPRENDQRALIVVIGPWEIWVRKEHP